MPLAGCVGVNGGSAADILWWTEVLACSEPRAWNCQKSGQEFRKSRYFFLQVLVLSTQLQLFLSKAKDPPPRFVPFPKFLFVVCTLHLRNSFGVVQRKVLVLRESTVVNRR